MITRNDEDHRWAAVLTRDTTADGAFVYAVTTTGICCRPSCASRRPRREHARFFPDVAAARAAGFRPCQRCQPEADRSPASALVAACCRVIEERLPESLSLAALGAAVGYSPFHVQRVFRAALGVTPRQYAAKRRLDAFKDLTRSGADVTGALAGAGYGSSSRLYETAGARLGMTPGSYRRGGRAMRIGYTVVDAPLGRLLVGATERGICAVSLGDDDEPLVMALRAEYPAATITPDDALAGPLAAAIVASLVAFVPPPDLPLDVRGTAFQARVWAALRDIPAGQTRSYGDVAAAIGAPGSARAVARACATNPACLVIPCHRVTRADGAIGGYRWGVARKRRLLAAEGALKTTPDSAATPTR